MSEKLYHKICQYVQKDMGLPESDCEYIGSGMVGKTYDLGDDKVIKITRDGYEYHAIKTHIVGKNIDGLVHYYKTYIVEDIAPEYSVRDHYVLVMDKVETINEFDEKRLWDILRRVMRFFNKDTPLYILKEYVMQNIHEHIKTHGSLVGSPLWQHLIQSYNKEIPHNYMMSMPDRYLKLFALFAKASSKLIDQGIIHRDPHGGNVGWDPFGNFVFFDYG